MAGPTLPDYDTYESSQLTRLCMDHGWPVSEDTPRHEMIKFIVRRYEQNEGKKAGALPKFNADNDRDGLNRREWIEGFNKV
ncbi:hypothetical protein ONS95_014044 [Cadophora gregata]|uniref:uncharacterized protein n=1 Tax=Cadophora gregata TaxID=51156 RepID=UPI0026DBBB61|nr:uncharacterized protein ONS95_014044 [Cadophora gregata]KAK0113794.1 hypothetical protein ONS96_014649 [Cadophora gregata f. sp. sojae]KAK0114554.1 hypothetical protein ONS95_014044 [Cadophora gregata]